MVNKERFGLEKKITEQTQLIIQRLRQEREDKGISQMDLSLKAGLSQNQVNYIETGKRTPNLNTILRICNTLEINPAILFEPNNTERQKARDTVINLITQYL